MTIRGFVPVGSRVRPADAEAARSGGGTIVAALAVIVILMTASHSGTAQAAEATCPKPKVTIHAEALSDKDIQIFEKRLRRAIRKVCAWWGDTFDGPYTVNIEDNLGSSMAMIPAWRGHRGTMLFRSGKTRRGRSPILHEVTHIFAPNANRFLAEGLAVYAHEHLGGQPAYPNFGRDLYKAVKPDAADADLPLLDSIIAPKGLMTPDRPKQLKAYLVAGAFVRYLIETRGMDKFRTLYAMTPMVPHRRIPSDPDRWQKVYGKSLEALAVEWKAFIASVQG